MDVVVDGGGHQHSAACRPPCGRRVRARPVLPRDSIAYRPNSRGRRSSAPPSTARPPTRTRQPAGTRPPSVSSQQSAITTTAATGKREREKKKTQKSPLTAQPVLYSLSSELTGRKTENMAAAASDADWEQAEGVPSLSDPFIQKYLQGRDALVQQEKKQRSGPFVHQTPA